MKSSSSPRDLDSEAIVAGKPPGLREGQPMLAARELPGIFDVGIRRPHLVELPFLVRHAARKAQAADRIEVPVDRPVPVPRRSVRIDRLERAAAEQIEAGGAKTPPPRQSWRAPSRARVASARQDAAAQLDIVPRRAAAALDPGLDRDARGREVAGERGRRSSVRGLVALSRRSGFTAAAVAARMRGAVRLACAP